MERLEFIAEEIKKLEAAGLVREYSIPRGWPILLLCARLTENEDFVLTTQISIKLVQRILSLCHMIRLLVSNFPNTFALVLDSNLHDLNGTNPD